MDAKDMMLPLVAALWACGTLVFTVTRELNAIRDKVLGIGNSISASPLTKEQIKVLIYHDWIPLYMAVVIIAVIFCAVACISPLLVESKQRSKPVWIVAILVAVYSAFMAGASLYGAHADWKVMCSALPNCQDK